VKSFHAIRSVHIHRPIRTTLAVLALAAVPAGAAIVPAVAGNNTAATATSTVKCPTGWGSLPKANTWRSSSTLKAVRAGRHACFDRVVFDIVGNPPGYTARYVSNVFRAGAGHLVPIRGAAKLEIMIGVNEFDYGNHWAFQPRDEAELANVSGYRTLRQIAGAGTLEGAQVIGLGLRARLPYRIFILEGPGTGSRIVVDVAHRW
jgi:hypothetical protein